MLDTHILTNTHTTDAIPSIRLWADTIWADTIEVPTFDGDLLKWKSFWEQFSVSIHNRTDVTNAENMVYLQNALEDHTAISIPLKDLLSQENTVTRQSSALRHAMTVHVWCIKPMCVG